LTLPFNTDSLLLMKSLTLKEIATAGLIAAVYAVLAAALAPISFGVYQVRVSEALTVLPFITRAAIPGLFIGCMLANVIGGLGWMDIVFGSLITLVAALATRGFYHLSNRDLGNSLMGALGTLMSGNFAPLALIPVLASVVLLKLATVMGTERSPKRAYKAVVRVLSLALVLFTFWMFRDHPQWDLLILGGVALIAAWLVTWLITHIRASGSNPNLALAPLPPVLFNAFGVAVYLAPIIGVKYMFAVQMIGIGQLIACYLLGLPLLLILERRKSVLF
jgi:uncharacterized membrane protein